MSRVTYTDLRPYRFRSYVKANKFNSQSRHGTVAKSILYLSLNDLFTLMCCICETIVSYVKLLDNFDIILILGINGPHAFVFFVKGAAVH